MSVQWLKLGGDKHTSKQPQTVELELSLKGSDD